jgi:hypothetical protein
MQEQARGGSTGAVIAILGSVAAIVGTFLTWGEVTGASIGGTVFGQEIPTQTMTESDLAEVKKLVDLSYSGFSSFPGILLIVFAAVAIVGAWMRMSGGTMRSLGSVLAAGGGGAALVMGVIGLVGRGAAATDTFFEGIEKAAQADPTAAQALGGLGVDMGEVFDLIRDFVTVETSIGIGLIVSLAGAVVALLGGLMSLGGARQAMPEMPAMPMPPIDTSGGFGGPMSPPAQPPSDQPSGEGPEAPGS